MDLFNELNEPDLFYLSKKSPPKPFLKWVGGKRSIIEDLLARIPSDFNDYYEPFLGGGAMFFKVGKNHKSFLSDLNLELIITYKQVKDNPLRLIELLNKHKENNSEEYYYNIRSKHSTSDPLELAARFIYLNKTCYNGLYRVNSKKEFNVPYGKHKNPGVFQVENILEVSEILKPQSLLYKDFSKISPKSGDFVYLDPPYHSSNTSSFTRYTENDFTEKDQIRLRDFTKVLHKKGVKFMLSNSNSNFIKKLYNESHINIDKVLAPRNINCKSLKRKGVTELIIRNYAY